jgi:hypothetical protein
MRNRKPILLMLLCCVAILPSTAKAQAPSVKILQFEIDGKEAKDNFKIFLYLDGKAIEPVRIGNSFLVPSEIKNYKTVGVRFLSGGYDLFFNSVHPSKFSTDWIVGVDKKPFDQEYVTPKEARKLKLIYYLQFVSQQGDDTRLVVKVHV